MKSPVKIQFLFPLLTMTQIIKSLVFMIFINLVANIQISSSNSIESRLIDDKNINWMGAIFTRLSKFGSFNYKCQGVVVDSNLIYTVDQCIGPMDPVENIRVRIYKVSGANSTGATDSEEREVQGIGYQRIYLSSPGSSIPVRRLTHLYLKTPFNLKFNVEFPTKTTRNFDVANSIDVNDCFYTNLQKNDNGFNIKQSRAKYITSKETCCDENGNHVCTACNIGRSVFCAKLVGKALESLNQNGSLASSLACKSKSNNSIFVVGISINNSECAPRFTKL